MTNIFNLRRQGAVCKQVGADFVECEPGKFIGIGKNFDASQDPIYGIRHPIEGVSTGWFIWSGQKDPKNDEFFDPLHAIHLKEMAPQILDYLGLAPGWGFVIDNNGYEDVWFDEKLLDIA